MYHRHYQCRISYKWYITSTDIFGTFLHGNVCMILGLQISKSCFENGVETNCFFLGKPATFAKPPTPNQVQPSFWLLAETRNINNINISVISWFTLCSLYKQAEPLGPIYTYLSMLSGEAKIYIIPFAKAKTMLNN